MKKQKKLTIKQKQKIADEWIAKNGCCTFDLKEEEIIFHDGGGFSVEKVVKYLPRHRWMPIKEGPSKGGASMVEIKGPKVRYEFYDCYYSFCDLEETINRLIRMKKMLNGIGYKTNLRNEYNGGKKK